MTLHSFTPILQCNLTANLYFFNASSNSLSGVVYAYAASEIAIVIFLLLIDHVQMMLPVTSWLSTLLQLFQCLSCLD